MAAAASPAVPTADEVEFLAAYVRHAGECAAHVSAFLTRVGADIGRREQWQFPGLFLYELGAILRIAHWQQSAALSVLFRSHP